MPKEGETVFARRKLLTAGLLALAATPAVATGGILYLEALDSRIKAITADLRRLKPSDVRSEDIPALYELAGASRFTLIWPTEIPITASWGQSKLELEKLFKNQADLTSFANRATRSWDPNSEPDLSLGLTRITPFVTDGHSGEGIDNMTDLRVRVPSGSVRIFARTVGNFPVSYTAVEEMMPDGKMGFTLDISANPWDLDLAVKHQQASIDGTPFPTPSEETVHNPVYSPQILILPINQAFGL